MAYISFQPSDYFNTKLYTGTGATNAISGIGFQPDWIWSKNRDSSGHHFLVDVLRGTEYELRANNTNHSAGDGNLMDSFDSDGFTLSSSASMNTSSDDYVAWNWKAGGSGSSNSDGSIASTVSANTTAGFSIVKWTGTGSNATIGHGLSTAPRTIYAKNLAVGSGQNWFVFNKGLYDTDNTGYINLNTTDGKSQSSTVWQSTAPTSSVFSTGAAFSAHDYIAYCFSDVKGFSKSGVYSGNNSSDGVYIHLGFTPKIFIFKRYGANGDNWIILTNNLSQSGSNVVNNYLSPSTTSAETTNSSNFPVDFLSQGVKLRGTDTGMNASSDYIYHAFAEFPTVSSNDIPATAR